MSHGRHRKPTNTKRNIQRAGAGTFVAFLATGQLSPAAADLNDPTWGAIIHCESGGQNIPNTSGSSASGFFQITDGTWRGAGGEEFAPRAIDATYEQQAIVAERIREARGSFADWNASRHCWEPMLGAPPPPPAPLEEEVVVTPEPLPESPTDAFQIVVVSGDTVSEIAIEDLGLPAWEPFYEQNRAVIGDNPNLIFPGQVFSTHGGVVTPPPVETPTPPVAVEEEPPPAADVAGQAVHPLHDGARITSEYGPRGSEFHGGLDFDCTTGDVVVAALAGIVEVAGWNDNGAGNWVRVRHPDGSLTGYAHLSSVSVERNQFVETGQEVGRCGATGDVRPLPTPENPDQGSHLHFLAEVGPGSVNPRIWLADRGLSV